MAFYDVKKRGLTAGSADRVRRRMAFYDVKKRGLIVGSADRVRRRMAFYDIQKRELTALPWQRVYVDVY